MDSLGRQAVITTHTVVPWRHRLWEEKLSAGEEGRAERERETETEQASERERRGEREREKNRKKQREKGTDKALLPDSRQPSFPYPAKCNSSNAATGSVLPDSQSEKGIFSIALLLQINSLRAAGSTFFIYAPLWGMHCFSSGIQYM